MVLCNNDDDKSKNAALLSIVRKLNIELDNLKKNFQDLNDENKLVIEPSIKKLDECISILEKILFMEYNYVITNYIMCGRLEYPRTSAYDYPEIFRQAIEEYNKRKGL